MVRQYFAHPIVQVRQTTSDESAALQLVRELMLGINLCAAAEAVSFARFLKVDLAQFYTLVSNAAGASRVFIGEGRDMVEGRTGAGRRTVDQAVDAMEGVAQKARDLECPLHLGNAALSVLTLAKRGGYGAEGWTSVSRVFGA
jgi:3-hydroxyisobutyrate dehydrogenase